MIYQIQNNQVVELTADYVEYLYHSYLPDNCLVISDSLTDLDYIKSLADKFSCIVFDHCINPFDIETKLSKLIELDISFYILSGNYNYFGNNVPDTRVKFFPFWAIWTSGQQYQFSHSLKQYNFSCLNGTPWEHRKLTYLYLSNRDYFSDMIFTFGNRLGYTKISSHNILTQKQQQAFDQLPQTVKFIDSDETCGIDLTVEHPAYQKTYVNLVTETTVNRLTPMLSEKTFKPIASGQLFILIASPGAVDFLRQAGIDCFDDIIDHGYDTVIDSGARIEQALDQLDLLNRKDLNSLHKVLAPRLLKNSQYFNSQEFRNQFMVKFG